MNTKSETKIDIVDEKVENSIKEILRFIGEDPERDGLLDTPRRVAKMYKEVLGGYNIDPLEYLSKMFEETDGYDEMIVLRDIRFVSMCEHHMLPFIGRAHIAYIPTRKVVGISKIARVVDALSRRLQIQERLTTQIAKVIDEALQPKGVAVVMEAVHQCMTIRGINKQGVSMQTSYNTGAFRNDSKTRQEFFNLVNSPTSASKFA